MHFHLPFERAEQILSRMTPEQKIGQMLMASIEVTEMDDRTRAFLQKNCIGNIILFGKNCVDREQIVRLNHEIQDEVTRNAGVQAILAIDQEGGSVTRLRRGATVFPCAMAVGATGDPENAYLVGHMMGNEMRELGIYFDCAPVLDINVSNDDPVVGRRSYGETWQETALYGGAFAKGLREAGIIDCGKHFPGEGYARQDTHFDFVTQDIPREVIVNELVAAFREPIRQGLRAVMITHIYYPALDPDGCPASLSAPVIQGMLRKELEFEGLIISDGLQMLAIADRYGAPRGAVLAAKAGCDLLIIGNGGDNAAPDGEDVQTPCVKALLEAVRSGELPLTRVDEAARRVIAFKLAMGDMHPSEQVLRRDWRAHEAFARALSKMCVTVHRDTKHLLPIPPHALFLSRVSHARLGVEEGDKLTDGFAPMAAGLLDGEAFEYQSVPDIETMKDNIAFAPAIVVGITSKTECLEMLEALRKIYAINERLCVVCMDAPYILKLVPFVPCAVSSYDKTANAMRGICETLKGKQSVP